MYNYGLIGIGVPELRRTYYINSSENCFCNIFSFEYIHRSFAIEWIQWIFPNFTEDPLVVTLLFYEVSSFTQYLRFSCLSLSVVAALQSHNLFWSPVSFVRRMRKKKKFTANLGFRHCFIHNSRLSRIMCITQNTRFLLLNIAFFPLLSVQSLTVRAPFWELTHLFFVRS